MMKKKPLIQELNSNELLAPLEKHVKPEYRIYVQPEDIPNKLIVDIWLPDVVILHFQFIITYVEIYIVFKLMLSN